MHTSSSIVNSQRTLTEISESRAIAKIRIWVESDTVVVLKNNRLGTVNIIFINKRHFLIFHFSDLRNLVKCMDSVISCYYSLNI